MTEFIIFTDGACPNNGKKGAYAGYGIYFKDKDYPDVSQPFEIEPITNQRAELYAILIALRIAEETGVFAEYDEVVLYTDSQYSIDSLTKWVKAWVKNDWITSKKEPVKNKEIIKPIYNILKRNKNIRFEHVEAHTKKTDPISKGNKRADDLASAGALKSLSR